jgi:hypothetical protein
VQAGLLFHSDGLRYCGRFGGGLSLLRRQEKLFFLLYSFFLIGVADVPWRVDITCMTFADWLFFLAYCFVLWTALFFGCEGSAFTVCRAVDTPNAFATFSASLDPFAVNLNPGSAFAAIYPLPRQSPQRLLITAESGHRGYFLSANFWGNSRKQAKTISSILTSISCSSK